MLIKDFTHNILRMADAGGAGAGSSGGDQGGDKSGDKGGKSQSGDKGGTGTGDKSGQAGDKSGAGSGTGAGAGDQGGDKGGQSGDKSAGDGTKKTILDDAGQSKSSTPADWPTDWRQKGIDAAGVPEADKAKVLGMLERLTSPGDLVKKVIEQDKLIAQGKHKTSFPKDGTDEQKNAWRKDNGVPEAADKYDLTLPDGLTISEDDKPIVNSIVAAAYAENLTNGQLKSLLSAYYKSEGEYVVQRETEMANNKTQQDDALHQEWGEEYRDNINVITRLRDSSFSKETQNALAGALDSDGFPLLNNKNFLKDLALIARIISPIDTVPGSGGGNQMDSVNDRIKAIEEMMSTNREAYFKDAKVQKEYLDLIDWRERNTQKK